MKFGSVCSGIEAASVAWEPLGWKAAWFSEIEPFPCAVLKHHYPDVPNFGDMTTLPRRIISGEIEAPDLFCGGTPCQAFSVAGMRKSLDDARGNLSLTFCEIANAIDNVRLAGGEHPAIIFWENVPGVLSTKDNAFGCFLAGLAGENGAVEPPRGKWTNAGCVYGPQRAVAWRVLDAQYFGVAQRRKRVFVVASARDDFDPAAVLFEFDGVRRDTAPSREAWQRLADSLTVGANQCSGRPGDFVEQPYPVANCLTARMHKGINSTLDEGQTPVISIQDVTAREKAQNGKGWSDDGTSYTVDTHATQGVAQPISFGAQMSVPQVDFDLNQTLQAKNPMAVAQPIPIDTMNHVGRGDHHSFGDFEPGAPSYTLTKGHSHAVATAMQVRRLTPVECERLQGFPDNYTNVPWNAAKEAARKGISYEAILALRGMTLRGPNLEDCPDGPRYKALGNSWAVPVVRWIGKRIETEIKCKPNK